MSLPFKFQGGNFTKILSYFSLQRELSWMDEAVEVKEIVC